MKTAAAAKKPTTDAALNETMNEHTRPHPEGVKNDASSQDVLEMGISRLFRVPACSRARCSLSTGN
jgi:hypothetical protein